MFEFEISPVEANYWWRRSDPMGALLNKLMFLFIVVPIALVLKSFYGLSFVVFAFMVPYGLFLRHLAVRAVRHHLTEHPEKIEEFEQAGIISC
jgi:vacuolar-type H+-ATPase subunit I/STV1